jgi:hypothetical protein
MSSLLFSIAMEPGDVRLQLPWLLVREQIAPVVGGVAMFIDCVDPFIIEAQPGNASISANVTSKFLIISPRLRQP